MDTEPLELTRPDRRGIDDQGRASKPKRRLSSVAQEIASLIRHTSNIHTFRFPKKSDRSGGEDARVGSFSIETAWPLNNQERHSWAMIEQTIDAIIARTPVMENEFSPSILVEAYRLGKSRDTALPTVLIGCTSRSYATKLLKTLKRSGVLQTDTCKFQVIIRETDDDDEDEWPQEVVPHSTTCSMTSLTPAALATTTTVQAV